MLKLKMDMFVNSTKVTTMVKNQLNLMPNVNQVTFLPVFVNKLIKLI